MKTTVYNIAIAVLAAAMLTACVFENDMSYPRIYAGITSFAVEGQKSSTIDGDTRTVQIVLGETADRTALKVTEAAISQEARCPDFPSAGDVIDLSGSVTYVLSTYQDYEWTVSATQPIERYVNCENSASAPIIDSEMKMAHVYVLVSQSLQDITITGMKLEKEGSEIYLVTRENGEETVASEPCTFPMENVDALTGLEFEVRYDDTAVRWRITFEQEIIPVEITSADPWCYHVDVEATYGQDGTPYIQYRKADSDEWLRFDDVETDGINISASIPGGDTSQEDAERLEPGTAYEFKVCAGTSESDVVTVTTGTPDQIYNMGFDDWYSTKSGAYDIWHPNLNDTYKIWGTANPGSGNFVGSLTTPTDKVAVQGDGKMAARLESKNAVIAFAAGNIFTGQFGKINGLGAILDWGTPFTARPRALKGYYAYEPAPVNTAKPPYEDLKNTMDKCQILVMLTDWTGPFTVNTTEGIFVDQSQSNSSIIAYGKIESDKNTFEDPSADANGYIPFELELDYWRSDAIPSYAVVIACASYKGDFFTGGVGSVMYVDEFEFVYD